VFSKASFPTVKPRVRSASPAGQFLLRPDKGRFFQFHPFFNNVGEPGFDAPLAMHAGKEGDASGKTSWKG